MSPITCCQVGCLSVCVSMCMCVSLEQRLWTAWLWLCAAATWVSSLTLACIRLCSSTVKSLSCVVCTQSPHVNIVMLSLKSKAWRSNSGFAVRLWCALDRRLFWNGPKDLLFNLAWLFLFCLGLLHALVLFIATYIIKTITLAMLLVLYFTELRVNIHLKLHRNWGRECTVVWRL